MCALCTLFYFVCIVISSSCHCVQYLCDLYGIIVTMNSTLFKCVAPPQVKGVKYVWKMWRGSIYCLACSSTVLSHRFCTVFTCSVFFGNISWNSITHYRFGFRTQLKLSYSQDLLAYTISLQVVLLRVCWMDGQCQYRRTTNCTKHNNKSSNKRTMIRNEKNVHETNAESVVEKWTYFILLNPTRRM